MRPPSWHGTQSLVDAQRAKITWRRADIGHANDRVAGIVTARGHPGRVADALGAQHAREIVLRDGGLGEEHLHQLAQARPVVGHDRQRSVIRFADDGIHLVVNGRCCPLADLHLALVALHRVRVRQQAQLVAHADVADLLLRELRRLAQVVRRTGREVPEDRLLGGPASKQHRHAVEDVLLGVQVLVRREHLAVSHRRGRSRHDRDGQHAVGALQQPAGQRVPRLVGRDLAAVRGTHHLGGSLNTANDARDGILEIGAGNGVTRLARGLERGLVHNRRDLGAAHAGRHRGQEVGLRVGRGRQPDLAQIQLRNRPPLGQCRQVAVDLAIEAAGAQDGLVEDIQPVCRGKHNQTGRALEAIHLDQQLVQGVLTLAAAAAQ
eukprot:m.83512 g.83512  ORF g.83512 m.83512 type:complete len:378 (+) comp8163_c1_seq2:169-1302(+)